MESTLTVSYTHLDVYKRQGKYLAHAVRLIRLPRPGASCPVGLGVSCSADRNIKCKINKEGIWIEKLLSLIHI